MNKKIVAFICTILMILSVFSPAISAETTIYSDYAFPEWAKEGIAPESVTTIENANYRVNFYTCNDGVHQFVQNEILRKCGDEFVVVKKRTEDFGYLLLCADSSSYKGMNSSNTYLTTQTVDGTTVDREIDIYKNGTGEWFIPKSVTYGGSTWATLNFDATNNASLSVQFSLGATKEPKVKFNTTFKKAGAYSFMMFNGDGVKDEDYHTITAPLGYVKHDAPSDARTIPESFMYTPMGTLTFSAAQDKAGNGKTLTTGIAVDPQYAAQGFLKPTNSRFGMVLRTADGLVRPQLVYPLFGGAEYVDANGNKTTTISGNHTFSYRIIADFNYWYDTFRYVTEDMYNSKDIRTNYYSSLTDAIFNATNLWKTNYAEGETNYNGWDQKAMAHYNMEGRGLVSQTAPMEAAQRYLLTEDEEILENRTIPTIAYVLSRGGIHFHYADISDYTSTQLSGVTNYLQSLGITDASQLPMPLDEMKGFNLSTYEGLYEMTNGRMPVLLDYATSKASSTTDIRDESAIYRMTKDQTPESIYKVLKVADTYISNGFNKGTNREKAQMGGFVFSNYLSALQACMTAYELTSEQKYLDAATEAGQYMCTALHMTGYHNDFATTDATYNSANVQNISHPHDGKENTIANFFWHGDTKWRLPYKTSDVTVAEETVPGWLSAQTGLGIEHWYSPVFGSANQMNLWAGSLAKLSYLTGNESFATAARNAMLGRYGGYGGYDRVHLSVHQMHPDYAFTGPNTTMIYYHHLPSFIAMLEEFLVSEVENRSKGNIYFPSVQQFGYAYFDTNQYGQSAGKFYDEEDMWLYLKEDVITVTDTKTVETPYNTGEAVNVDYLMARKDGKLGIALMNEAQEENTATVKINNSSYTGTAKLYDENGEIGTVNVSNGTFSVNIPVRGIRSVVISLSDVTKPAFAKTYEFSNELGETVSDHGNGKGYIIQLNDKFYHAYTFVKDKDLDSLTLNYTAGNESGTEVCTEYPFEFITKVSDPNVTFNYTLTAVKDGKTTTYSGSLKTLSASNVTPKLTFTENVPYYNREGSETYNRREITIPEFKSTILQSNQTSSQTNFWRIVVKVKDLNESGILKEPITETTGWEQVEGLPVVLAWTPKADSGKTEVIKRVSYIERLDLPNAGWTENGNIVVLVRETPDMPAKTTTIVDLGLTNDYTSSLRVSHGKPNDVSGNFVVKNADGTEVYPVFASDLRGFEDVDISYNSKGRETGSRRFVLTKSQTQALLASLNLEMTELDIYKLENATVYVDFCDKRTAEKNTAVSYIKKVEIKKSGNNITGIVLVIPETSNTLLANVDEANYNIKLNLHDGTPRVTTGISMIDEDDYKPFTTVTLANSGRGNLTIDGKVIKVWRLGISNYTTLNTELGFDANNKDCDYTGLMAKIKFTPKNAETTAPLYLDSIVVSQGRSGGGTGIPLLIVAETLEAPTMDNALHTIEAGDVTIYYGAKFVDNRLYYSLPKGKDVLFLVHYDENDVVKDVKVFKSTETSAVCGSYDTSLWTDGTVKVFMWQNTMSPIHYVIER